MTRRQRLRCTALPSFLLAVMPARGTVDGLEQALRRRERPIVGRIAHDRYLLDARTLNQEDFAAIAAAVTECAL